MFYLTPPRHISTLPRLCENAKAINRDRTSYSFKTVSCAHIASAFNFEIEIKNIILVALRTFEFSHGLGQKRKSDPAILTSVLPSTADIRQRGGHVRKVPLPDSKTPAVLLLLLVSPQFC